MSRSYVRENQNDDDNLITLRGKYFYPHQTCVLFNETGFISEEPLFEFIDEETVVCRLPGIFFKADK